MPLNLTAPAGAPQPPTPRNGPAAAWEHRALYDDVVKTLYALPEEFTTSLRISDFRATDIFTLSGALGASIEDSVVLGLNRLREVWDPDGKYRLYRFERQSQAFPDVRLVNEERHVLMGIELKGWFALAKEGEPNFRFKATPNACADADLLVVYPWVLSDVIAGSPKLLRPFVGEARYAAEVRNYHWQYLRESNEAKTIRLADHQAPYPKKDDRCSDIPDGDSGGNFGRIARSSLLDDFLEMTSEQQVSGIPAKAWTAFFKIFNDSARDVDEMERAVTSRLKKYAKESNIDSEKLIEALQRFIEMVRGGN